MWGLFLNAARIADGEGGVREQPDEVRIFHRLDQVEREMRPKASADPLRDARVRMPREDDANVGRARGESEQGIAEKLGIPVPVLAPVQGHHDCARAGSPYGD